MAIKLDKMSLEDLKALKKQVEERYTSGDIVSRHPAMRKVLDILPVVAESGSTILITGETGTGK